MLYNGIFQLNPDTKLNKFPLNLYGKYIITIKDIYIRFHLRESLSNCGLNNDKLFQEFAVYSPDFIKSINNLDASFFYPDTYHNLNLKYYTILNGYLNLQIKQIAPPKSKDNRIITGGEWDFDKCYITLEFEKINEETKI